MVVEGVGQIFKECEVNHLINSEGNGVEDDGHVRSCGIGVREDCFNRYRRFE